MTSSDCLPLIEPREWKDDMMFIQMMICVHPPPPPPPPHPPTHLMRFP